AQIAQRKSHDKPDSDVSYEVGQVVRVKNPSWLKKKKKSLTLGWHGPYIITEKVGPGTYRVKAVRGGVLPDPIHVNRMIPTKELERQEYVPKSVQNKEKVPLHQLLIFIRRTIRTL